MGRLVLLEPEQLSQYSDWTTVSMTGILFPVGLRKRFFVVAATPRPALVPTQPSFQWVLGFSPGVKRPLHEDDNSPPSSAEVNSWICTSAPKIRFHGVVLN
jgi:hypothetical protein